MAENKKSFILYADLLQSIEHLTNEEKGILFNHLLEYVNDMNPSLDDRLILTAWKPIELQLKRDLVKFEEVKAKRSEAGKRSAEIRALKTSEHNSTNPTSVESVQQTSTNPTDNDTVNENDNENDTVILLEKETKGGEVFNSENEPDKIPEIPSKKVAPKKVSFQPPEPKEVQQYCDERQNQLSGQEFCDFYTSKDWMIGKNKMKDWRAAVRTWEKYRTNGNTKNNGFSTNGKNGSGKVSGTQNLIDGIEYFEFT